MRWAPLGWFGTDRGNQGGPGRPPNGMDGQIGTAKLTNSLMGRQACGCSELLDLLTTTAHSPSHLTGLQCGTRLPHSAATGRPLDKPARDSRGPSRDTWEL